MWRLATIVGGQTLPRSRNSSERSLSGQHSLETNEVVSAPCPLCSSPASASDDSPSPLCRTAAAPLTRCRSTTCNGEVHSPHTVAAKCASTRCSPRCAPALFFQLRTSRIIACPQVSARQSAKKFYVIDKIIALNTSDSEQLQGILTDARESYNSFMVRP
jgi:hypothetical protein